MSYLDGLNPAQKEAVLKTEGPLLIIAGAGAGKTKTLTHRILHIIKEGVTPSSILAITFTNKAAKEMKERVFSLLSSDRDFNNPISNNERPMIRTFHSLGVHILREQHRLLGLPKQFTIYDRADSIKIVRDALKKADFDPKQYEPKKILGIISREKGEMNTFAEYEMRDEYSYIKEAVVVAWRAYEKQLKEEGALDFDDLLIKTALILKNHEDIREYYQNIWKYIHVDEYQDTNEVQYMITKLLAEKNKNLCVVGDIDQNIYTWRGASIKNLLHFEKDYPNAHEVILEENYRSTKRILSIANDVISKNKMRREKNLFTNNAEGDKVTLYNGFDEYDEARFIAESSDNLIREGTDPKEIAVLYRANFQSRVLEEAFLRAGISYQVLGTRFFDRKEVKDVLSYVKAALNPADMASTGRIINNPTRGIGKVSYLKICEGKENELSGKAKISAAHFRQILSKIKKVSEEKKVSDTIQAALEESGLYAVYKKAEDIEKIDNVKELISLAKKYDEFETEEGILKLLEDAALATDQDSLEKDNGGVKLMTIHASKGLEFDYVFITGLEAGLFPSERDGEKKDDDEEERRLFYVALTRARKKLFLSYAGIRTVFGSQSVNAPSEFLDDIDIEHLDEERPDITESSAKSIFIDF